MGNVAHKVIGPSAKIAQSNVLDLPADLAALQALEIDATGVAWNSYNPNWIDPSTVNAFKRLELTNASTGCEIWYASKTVSGTPIWKQVI